MNDNLRKYIRKLLAERNVKYRQVSTAIGFNRLAIFRFIQENIREQSISSVLALGVTDYFNVSLDEMTGRVEANQVKYVGIMGVNQDKIAETDGKLNPPPNLQELVQDIKDMKNVQKDVKTLLQRFPYKENDKDEK